MNEIALSNYGPIFAALLADAPLNELGPGKPLPAQRKKLEALIDRHGVCAAQSGRSHHGQSVPGRALAAVRFFG